MDNPLCMLQKYVVSKKQVSIENERINFGKEFSVPESVKTNYLIYGSCKNGTTKEYYSLKSLVFFLQNVQLQHGVYVREAVSANIPAVRRPDRKSLLAYLHGEVATTESIDKFAKPENLATVRTESVSAVGIKRPSDEGQTEEIAKKARLADAERLKAQLAAKLSNTKENRVSVEELKSLSEAMTVERIAAIKAKRLAKKRTTIKAHDDLVSSEEPTPMVFETEASTRDIVARERCARDRRSILQSAAKEFATCVFAILQTLKYREESRRPGYNPNVRPARPQLPGRSSTYSRYDQERFSKQDQSTPGFTINTTCTFYGQNLKAITDGEPGHKQPIQPPLPLNGISANKSNTPAAPSSNAPKKRVSTTPIIIIPSSLLSLITTLNVVDILQELKFVSNDEKKASATKKESEILIQRRKPGGLTVPYRVTENPLKLAPDEWNRVVAIFVVGPAWQFKHWPIHNSNPVNIFSNIAAFHLKYDDMPLDANIARWAVKTINISRTKRYLDRAALMQFWELLDKETNKKKTHLRL